jgi:hypothetical protein
MKKYILLLLALSSVVNANIDISGEWQCSTSSKPSASEMTMTFHLSINEKSTSFIRNGDITMKTGIPTLPEIALLTKEEGTLTFQGSEVTFTPLTAGLKVVRGKALIEDNDPKFMDMLIKDETGILQVSKNKFIVTLKEDQGVQTNTCTRL